MEGVGASAMGVGVGSAGVGVEGIGVALASGGVGICGIFDPQTSIRFLKVSYST